MSALSRNLSTRKLYILGLAVPLILTIVLSWLQWHSVNSMLHTRDWVRKSRAIQLSLSTFRYSLSDAESCQFRYLVSHSEVNLKPYDKSLADAEGSFATLRGLVADNGQQVQYLNQIEPLLNAKVGAMNNSLAKAKAGDFAGAMQAAVSDQSGDTMISLEQNVQQMQDAETTLLVQRQGVYQSKFQLTSLLSVGGMVLCLLCIMVTLLLLRRLSRLQSEVTLGALTELIEYEGGMIPIDEYLRRRRDALAEHGEAQIEAERLLGLLDRRKARPSESTAEK